MTYEPRPGSFGARAVDALADGPLPTRELARRIGADPDQMSSLMRSVLLHGVISWTRCPGPNTPRLWALVGDADDALAPRAPPGPTLPTHALDCWMVLARAAADCVRGGGVKRTFLYFCGCCWNAIRAMDGGPAQ